MSSVKGGLNEYSILKFDTPNFQRLKKLGNGLPVGLWDDRSSSRWFLLEHKIWDSRSRDFETHLNLALGWIGRKARLGREINRKGDFAIRVISYARVGLRIGATNPDKALVLYEFLTKTIRIYVALLLTNVVGMKNWGPHSLRSLPQYRIFIALDRVCSSTHSSNKLWTLRCGSTSLHPIPQAWVIINFPRTIIDRDPMCSKPEQSLLNSLLSYSG